jgi:hypothetical protein
LESTRHMRKKPSTVKRPRHSGPPSSALHEAAGQAWALLGTALRSVLLERLRLAAKESAEQYATSVLLFAHAIIEEHERHAAARPRKAAKRA